MPENVVDLLDPILENSKAAITVVDERGDLTLFNKAAELLTGYSRDEVLGRSVAAFYRSKGEAQKVLEAILERGKLEDHVTTLVAKDGREIPVSMLVTALHDAEGGFAGSLAIAVDISERRRLEEEVLRQRQRVFFYNDLLCHDVLNISQAALGILELLLEDEGLSSEQRRLLLMCRRQGWRTVDLVTRVRTLTTIETGGGEPTSPMELGPAIAGAIGSVLETFSGRGVSVHSPAVPDIRVMASPLLVDLIQNLLANAVGHNPSSGPNVWLQVTEVDRGDDWFVEVAFEDDGPGIPDQRKTQVFERYRGITTRGSGVGLSLVQALVREYGGSIRAEDRVAGDHSQGARMVVAFRKAR